MSRDAATALADRGGRRFIAVIGIDRYRAWQRLSNAVNDARGAMHAFERLGFEPLEPLLDESATADAIRSLVTDHLAKLTADDSLILFFAGHGHGITQQLSGGTEIKTGYIIPVDGDAAGGIVSRWLRLDQWLSDVARLSAKHILVLIDACHSGVALGALTKWRGEGGTELLRVLARRRSRRVITSALDGQRAMDGGPIPHHSLFTGCLIEGLAGGIAPPGSLVTGSDIGLYLQRRVSSYPQSTQTPDFGAFDFDDRGELVLEIAAPAAEVMASPPPVSSRHVSSSRHDQRADVAVLVALDEEFEQLSKLVQFDKGIADGHGGYYFPFAVPGVEREYSSVAKLIGEMGISAARGPAERMLDRWNPTVAIMVGIGASLDSGLKLGDIAVATQIDAYDASLKAVPGRRGGVEYLHRGTVFRGDPRLLAAIRDLRFAHSAEFEAFASACADDCDGLLPPDTRSTLQTTDLLSPHPTVHRVHVASGSVVGAASGFKRWLRRRDQTLKVLEMEGAALAEAAEGRQPQVPALVLRGISDFADERKRKLDTITGGGVRRYAMRNAVRFLLLLARLGVLPRHTATSSP